MARVLAARRRATRSSAGSARRRASIHLATAAVVNAALGPVGEVRGQAALEAAGRHEPRGSSSRASTSATSPTRSRPTRRSRCSTALVPTRGAREAELLRDGYPAYTTSVGWLGYSGRARSAGSAARRWPTASRTSRSRSAPTWPTTSAAPRSCARRSAPDRRLMIDANQRWDVGEAIEWMRTLARFDPWWIEEPTQPRRRPGPRRDRPRDRADRRRHRASTCANRVMFKQLLQAQAIGVLPDRRLPAGRASTRCWPCCCWRRSSACRSARTRAASGSASTCSTSRSSTTSRSPARSSDRIVEYVDHLHEHFVDPVVIRNGRYLPPLDPGYSAELRPESLADHRFPAGAVWAAA